MKALLNIGLDGTTFTLALRMASGLFNDFSVQARTAKTGEPTLVVFGDVKPELESTFGSRLWNVAHVLNQDCIACRIEGNSGHLYGPNASAWAPFKDEFFIVPPECERWFQPSGVPA